jgi:hypothetical protein
MTLGETRRTGFPLRSFLIVLFMGFHVGLRDYELFYEASEKRRFSRENVLSTVP